MRFGIDLGGTKIEAAAMTDAGAIVARRRIATPQGYAAGLEALTELVKGLEAEIAAPAKAVGVGLPGSPSPRTGLIRNANSQWLNGRRFGEDLAARLNRPVRLANDANCFALSEAVDGAAAGAAVVFGVILGTGCGGGVVAHGRLMEGAAGVAGEWGHTPLPWPTAEEYPGPACWCGRRGCLETWISGTGFREDYRRRSGQTREGAEIIAAMEAGDAAARAAFDALADRIARGLAVVIDIVDPDVIVFGGGLSNVDALYPAIAERLPAHVFSDHVATRLAKNLHGDSSGVRGAAWLWRPEELA